MQMAIQMQFQLFKLRCMSAKIHTMVLQQETDLDHVIPLLILLLIACARSQTLRKLRYKSLGEMKVSCLSQQAIEIGYRRCVL